MDDTIAAIATPLGEGGLAVLRISGPEAVLIGDRCFQPVGRSASSLSNAPTHTVHFGHIVNKGKRVDEALVTVMLAPRTFTRENVIEIACHGGVLPAKMVLETLLQNGARLATPGEFTRRAFLNGRIDLAQAEAVADLIHSRTEVALRAASEQLAGKLSHHVNKLRDQLMQTLAHIEAHIDFPDEDIAPETRSQLIARLESVAAKVEGFLEHAAEGQILRRGIRVAIAGRPNAGKSSLLNQLLGRDRAIVSAIPGTTRDTIEETANIRGLPIIFIDTAGLREARDEIEVEGIRRSRESFQNSEFILQVLDCSEKMTNSDRLALEEFCEKKRILVMNKTDLPDQFDFDIESMDAIPRAALVRVSCLTGDGLESLKDAIKELAWSGEIQADMLEVMINARHQEALERSRAAIFRTLEVLASGNSLELAALDLRVAVNAVGEIVGQTTTEDLLNMIFSQFCIGK